jgi:hypothetical protein
MTEQERQLKKTQLYQDIDLLEKDFLRQYPIDSRTGFPNQIQRPDIAILGIILGLVSSITMFVLSAIDDKRQVVIFVFGCFFLLFTIVLIVQLVTDTKPKYNKYTADKKKHEKKLAELRRQYDGL